MWFVDGEYVAVTRSRWREQRGDAEVLHRVADGLAGRPVVTHEIADPKTYRFERERISEVDGNEVVRPRVVELAWERDTAASLAGQQSLELPATP